MPRLQANILIADHSLLIREGLQEALQKPCYAIETAADGAQTRRMLKAGDFHLAILDLQMPGPSGMQLLQEVGQRHPDTQCIILTAHDNVHTAVEAMRKGAYDVVTKPVDLDQLRLIVARALDRFELVVENRKLHNRLEKEAPFRRLVRRSPAMQEAAATIKQVAQADVPVLLRGETGVGKDLVARAIHERSKRREAPFVAVNCGGFTEELFTSELFGHKRGAFTSAYADRPGRFTLAEGGTLFLDEIGEVSHKNQVELLRVLESHEFQPLGGPTGPPRRCAHHCRHQPRPRRRRRNRCLPQRPVLPPQRGPHRHSPLAPAAGRHPGLSRNVPRRNLPRSKQAPQENQPRSHGGPHRL